MSMISPVLGELYSRVYEAVWEAAPISFFNRICAFDRVSPWSKSTTLEISRDKLTEKVRSCKDKALLSGALSAPLAEWKKEVLALSKETIPSSSVSPLPSVATVKNELEYNPEMAEAITDASLTLLSKRTSSLVAISAVHALFGPKEEIEGSVLCDLVAKSENDPNSGQAIFDLYMKSYGQKKRFFLVPDWFISFLYNRCLLPVVSKAVGGFFSNALKEIRSSTTGDGTVSGMFQDILENLEEFLKDYQGNKSLDDYAGKKGIPELCKELSPYLVDNFFPNINFFGKSSGPLSLGGLASKILNGTVGTILNKLVQWQLKGQLPEILQSLLESVIASLSGEEAASASQKALPNHQFEISIVEFINAKLFAFAASLKEDILDIDQPPPPTLAKKLEGVIHELMKLSKTPSKDKDLEEGIRDGLIGAGYQLMKFWQSEQETILNQVLGLANLAFTEETKAVDSDIQKGKLDKLYQEQAKGVHLVCNRLFDLEVKKRIAGSPASQVQFQLTKQHRMIKRYLEEGVSNVAGLQNSLEGAVKGLSQPGYKGLDLVLGKHLVFWEEFLSLMEEGTQAPYPAPAKKILYREFYPLCSEGIAQVESISQLQDQWAYYTRHRALKGLFQRLEVLFSEKSYKSLDALAVGNVINQIETLLGRETPEVATLKAFLEKLEALHKHDSVLRDLEKVQNLLKYQKIFWFDQKKAEKLEALHKHDSVLRDLKKVQNLLKYQKIFGFDQKKAEKNARLLGKHASLQKDDEFKDLYLAYSAKTKQTKAILDLARYIREKLEEEIETIKDLQANLLYRMDPQTFSPKDLKSPRPLHAIFTDCGGWVQKTRMGYETLQKSNLVKLQEGVAKLQAREALLQKRIQKMKAPTLYFPVESLLNKIERAAGGSLGSIRRFRWLDFMGPSRLNYVSRTKAHLIQDISGLVKGIQPLVTAKKGEGGSENLYSWIEKLVLHKSVEYFKKRVN